MAWRAAPSQGRSRRSWALRAAVRLGGLAHSIGSVQELDGARCSRACPVVGHCHHPRALGRHCCGARCVAGPHVAGVPRASAGQGTQAQLDARAAPIPHPHTPAGKTTLLSALAGQMPYNKNITLQAGERWRKSGARLLLSAHSCLPPWQASPIPLPLPTCRGM